MADKIKLDPEDFKQFVSFYQLEKLDYSRTFKAQITQRRMMFMIEMGKKYHFNPRRAKVYSDGIIEIV